MTPSTTELYTLFTALGYPVLLVTDDRVYIAERKLVDQSILDKKFGVHGEVHGIHVWGHGFEQWPKCMWYLSYRVVEAKPARAPETCYHENKSAHGETEARKPLTTIHADHAPSADAGLLCTGEDE